MSATNVQAMVIFVDVRGFTSWSESEQAFQHAPKLIKDFGERLRAGFQQKLGEVFFKPLGDGAMLVRESSDASSPNHKVVRWASLDEFKKLPSADFIPGLKEQTLALIGEWKNEER